MSETTGRTIRRDSRELLADVRRQAPGRFALVILLTVLGALAEGLMASLLLVILPFLGIGKTGEGGFLPSAVTSSLDAVGLDATRWTVISLFVAVASVQASLTILQAWTACDLRNRYAASWQRCILRSAFAARWRFFMERESGQIVNAIVTEAMRAGIAFYLLSQVLATAVIIVIYVLIAFASSWPVAVSLLLAGLAVMGVTRMIVTRGHRVGTSLSNAYEDLQIHTSELVGAAKLIKASATEEVGHGLVEPIIQRLKYFDFAGAFQPHLLRAIFELAAAVGVAGFLLFASSSANVDAAAVLVIIAVLVRLYPKLSALQQHRQQLSVYLPAFSNLRHLMDAALAEAEQHGGKPLPPSIRDGPVEVRMENISVRHGTRRVLHGVNLEIPAGRTVALVGPSGAGKSTLADALLRLVEPSEGRIRISGEVLEELALDEWRRRVGYVAQDTLLLNQSIRENIAWGRGEYTLDEIHQAARKAAAHSFVDSLPDGYETVVGERGVRLSGGERQRFGLARALLGSPALLILDEPTSAIDAESERVVLDAIEALHGDLTILIIAHRLSTIRGADLVCVLEAGQILDIGSFDELVARDGRFRELWLLQSTDRPRPVRR